MKNILLLKILCNEHRLKIIKLLLSEKGGALCVGKITEEIGISQSLTSQNLSFLQTHEIIEGDRSGQTICYKMRNNELTNKIKKIIDILS